MTFSRRRLLRALGVGGLAAALGHPRRVRAQESAANLLIWWCGGGWDPTYVFDPHPDEDLSQDPAARLGSRNGLQWASATSRPSVDRFFSSYGDRAVIVNGIGVGSISHESAAILALTGGRSRQGTDLSTLLAAELASELPMPAINLGGPRYPGALGEFLTPVSALMVGTLRGELPAVAPARTEQEALLDAYLAEEGDIWAAGPHTRAWASSRARLERLIPDADRLSLPAEPTHTELQDLAVTVLSAGLTRVVLLPAPLPNQRTWDSHFANHTNQNDAFESSFSALTALLDRLATTAGAGGGVLLDETVVLVMSEMGRAPVLNPVQGKDHWPTTSWMVVGRDLQGERVVGGTSASLTGERTHLSTGQLDSSGEYLRPAHVLAGLAAHFGVDPARWFPDVSPLVL